MLINRLNQINNVLNELITLTKEDIFFIKEAKHNELFANIPKKEALINEFERLKSEIDNILISRNKPIEEIFSKEEEIEFEKFKTLLNEFNDLHRFFARLSITISNFYNTLLNKIKNKQQVTYDKDLSPNSKLKLKA